MLSAIVLGLVALPSAAQTTKPDEASIRFLNGLRAEDGGYSPAPARPRKSSLRATTSALRAIRYLGGQPEDVVATTKFVERCYDRSTGGFGDAPGEPPTLFSTAVGAMAAAELNVPANLWRDGAVKFLSERSKSLEEIRVAAAAFETLQTRAPRADEWLKQIAAARNPDGTFGSGTGTARATGGTAAMILRLGGTLEHRDAVLKAMQAGQRADGGFGTAERPESDLESSYRIVRAFHMMKERPADVAKLRAFVASCRAATGGYGERPGQPPTAAGTYFAAIILHWLDAR
jgi:Prenyltransferase and squalene oxidase repeat